MTFPNPLRHPFSNTDDMPGHFSYRATGPLTGLFPFLFGEKLTAKSNANTVAKINVDKAYISGLTPFFNSP